MKTERKENTNEGNNNKVLRFIFTAGISFAIGGIVAYFGKIIWGPYLYTITGLHYYFEFNYEYLDFIPFIVWGAVGGLGLGIAAKKDKKLHTLLGGLGFGIGFVSSVLFSAWSSSSGVSGMIGILTYKVTFGIVTSIISNELVHWLIMNLTTFIVTGLIGGAALGYGIYYVNKLSSLEAVETT